MNLYGEYNDLIAYLDNNLAALSKVLNVAAEQFDEKTAPVGQKDAEVWLKGQESAIEQVKIYALTHTKHICEDCGKEILDHGKFSAADIMLRAVDVYGKTLCFDCAVKRKKENNK